MSSSLSFSSFPNIEFELNIPSFYQCSSFISIKLNTTNFLLWKNQISPLVCIIGVLYHLLNGEKPTKEIKDDERNKNLNCRDHP